MNTVDSKKVELLDMGSGVSETTAEENVQKASAMPKQELVNAGMETMDEKNQVIKCSKKVVEQTAEVGTQSAVTSKDQGYRWGHQHQPIHLSVNASVMKHSECSECHSEEPWLLYNVRHKASYQRYCTHCLLKNFPGFFCPFCFHVYEESPQPKDRLMCIKCTSISHLSCVPSPHPPSFLCPACSSANLSFFNPTPSAATGRTIDKDSARALLAAAKIAAASMTKAAALAKVEAEKRVKDAAVAKKHAREALERLTYLAAKDREIATDRFNLKKLNANSNSASGLTRGAEKPSNGVYSIPVPPAVNANANANANAGAQAQQRKQNIPSVPIDK